MKWIVSHPQWTDFPAMNWHSFFDTEFHTEADDVSPDSQDGTLCLGDLNHFCQVKTCLRCKDHFSVRNMLHICRRMKIEMEVWSPVPTEMFCKHISWCHRTLRISFGMPVAAGHFKIKGWAWEVNGRSCGRRWDSRWFSVCQTEDSACANHA